MSSYIATVIKTGNSIALRVPKQYVVEAGIVPGEKVRLDLPKKQKQQNQNEIKRLFNKLKELNAFNKISDPVEWQKETRNDRIISGR